MKKNVGKPIYDIISISSFLALCQKYLVPHKEKSNQVACFAKFSSGNCFNQMFISWIDVGKLSTMLFLQKQRLLLDCDVIS